MLSVILIMATLTQCPQIIVRAIFWSVVKVSNRQYDVCLLPRLRVVSVCVVLHTAELATVICSFQNPFPYLFPILWVARFVFWLNWHDIYLLSICCLTFSVSNS